MKKAGLLFLFTGWAAGYAMAQKSPSAHGAAVLRELNCLQCHTMAGEGAGSAPNLGQMGRYIATPGAFMSALWNNTPRMFEEMAAHNVPRPVAAEADWRDMYAYLAGGQVSSRKADARRGGRAYDVNCAVCHNTGKAPLPKEWKAADPELLLEQMWNHASSMESEFKAANRPWAKLKAQDLDNLSAFARQQSGSPASGEAWKLPPAEAGQEAFGKYCASCHPTAGSWGANLRNRSWPEIGAALWNHANLMGGHPQLPEGSMRRILAWVWELQHQDAAPNVGRGETLFREKKCAGCHNGTDGRPVSPRPGSTFTVYSMAAVGWGPARMMHSKMGEKGAKWPWLSPQDVVDLAGYLNSLK